MGHDTDESAVTELTLFVDNDGDLYRQHAVPIFTNLVTKMARGVYDHARAVQAFSYLAEAGAKKYAREHGGGESEWHRIFPIEVRRKAAEAWAKSFEGEAELGNYDRLLPKKYREGGSTGKSADYQAGAEHAQLVAQYAPKSAIEYILAWKQVFPQAHRHIPEIAHLPLPKNSKKPAFKQGFLDRLRAIHEA
jgi:hypothetical protein